MAQRHQAIQGQYQGSHYGGDSRTHSDLRAAVRNKYFYGKLLDVFHLEMEQEYFNSKRWLLNRLVTGPGVVCGLRVELTDDGKSVIVNPGLAIDRCGREIVVANPSASYPLPELPPYKSPEESKGSRGQGDRYRRDEEEQHYCDIDFAHVLLCYHECNTEPMPALASDCESEAWCASGSIREQYSIEIREGHAPRRKFEFPDDIIYGDEINYRALVDYVTGECRPYPEDCCIPLVNIELRGTGDGWEPELDNRVCPVVYSNRLLYQLIYTMVHKPAQEE
jgi:hypothetical protein